MQQSLLISGTSHFFLLFLIIFFGWELNKKTESLPPPVQVSILSASKFDAALSTAPKLIVKKLDVKPQIVEELDQKPLLSMESSSSITIDKIKKIEKLSLFLEDFTNIDKLVDYFEDFKLKISKKNLNYLLKGVSNL